MAISADWASVIVAAAIGIGAGLGWLLRGRQDAKAILPVAMLRENQIEIINRCGEPLHVERIDAAVRVGIGDWIYDDYGGVVGAVYEKPPIAPNWEVPPKSTAWFPLYLEPGDDPRLSLTCSSSLRTLDSKTITVRRSQP